MIGIGTQSILATQTGYNFDQYGTASFEPIPEIYQVLKKNSEISLNPDFKAYMMGLSNKTRELIFTYYPNSPALSTSKPEIWEKDKNNFIAAVQGNISSAPKTFWWAKLIPTFITPLIAKYLITNSRQIKSLVIPLSDFIKSEKIKKIDLLKIDCEGEEVNWFDCHDGTKVWINQVNNDEWNCPDGEDEYIHNVWGGDLLLFKGHLAELNTDDEILAFDMYDCKWWDAEHTDYKCDDILKIELEEQEEFET